MSDFWWGSESRHLRQGPGTQKLIYFAVAPGWSILTNIKEQETKSR